MLFKDRFSAGRKLAVLLHRYQTADAIVLALARGGVPVGYEVASSLHLPLDVFVVRKIGAPENPELALGAVASGGTAYGDKLLLEGLGVDRTHLEHLVRKEISELHRRELLYRGRTSFPAVKGKIVILVDDGLATGASMRVAIRAVAKLSPQKIVVAVPVCPLELVREMQLLVDEFVCLEKPEEFRSVGSWYADFSQISDEEVLSLLQSRHSSL
jgi:predicted phosphoribosyltransferase